MGYVEPTEAAWSLLEGAVEPWLEDITRRASLGLIEAARGLGLGILQALKSAERHIRDDDLLVSRAPTSLTTPRIASSSCSATRASN